MRRPARVLAAALGLVLLLAAPAAARVEDPLELLGPGVAKSLDAELTNLHAADIDVVVTTHAPAGAAAEAAQVFAQRKRGKEAGLVLVAARDATAGVAVGAAYVERGLTPARLAALVDQTVPKAFREGVPSEGVVALVREIKLAYTLGDRPGYVPPTPPPRFPLWLVMALGALGVGAGAFALVKRARRRYRAALEEKVRNERGRLAKLREDLRLLGERLADPPDDPAARALAAAGAGRWHALDAEQGEIRLAMRGLSERLEAGDPTGVAEELARWQRRLAVLHLGVTTLVAGCAPLTADANAVADALSAAERRLAAFPDPAVAEALAAARLRAEAGQRVDALEHLARAAELAAPVDPDEAYRALMALPSAAPDRAAGLVARWVALRETVEAEEARDREARRPPRDALRGRLDDLERMLGAPAPDLVRATELLDATERLLRARRAEALPAEAL